MSPQAFELKDYRQPVVTSLGVILGFIVGFLGQWVTEPDFALRTWSDWVVFVGCFVGSLLLFAALFRMLQPSVPQEDALAHYRVTLKMYMVGLGAAFGGILVSAFI
ncbi:hypothetical protein [Rhodoferax aquaticus]|uniref:Uncharacterized protein n=1 Tax=Rhodoferax aquaticus TaxID=2527691 RepID=A0A515EV24_9BURK|nr:hypothetical protein [Rhodoferax aquaticus]QDL56535.1 hypothetical protein EXZ61_21565 [Rhodoferax aquaticus]